MLSKIPFNFRRLVEVESCSVNSGIHYASIQWRLFILGMTEKVNVKSYLWAYGLSVDAYARR